MLEVVCQTPAVTAVGSPLLFVHGVSHGAWCWEYWLGWFADRGREGQALSFRGHGASAGRDALDRFELDDYRDDLLSVARAMDRPVLVAHSMGGAVAQLAVAAEPELFGGLALVAAPPPDGLRMGEILPLVLQVRGMLNMWKLGQGRQLTTREVQALPFFDGRLSAKDAARFGALLQPDSKKVGSEAMKFRAPALPADLPILVLGSARDRLLPLSGLRRTAEHYSADLVVLDAPCHDMMLDPAWEEGATELAAWLEKRGL